MKARDFRALARQALAGRWGIAVLAGLVAVLLGGNLVSTGDSAGSSIGRTASDYAQEYGMGPFWDLPEFVIALFVILASILSIYAIVCFVIGGTVQLGYAKFNLALIDHKDAQVSDLFSQFHRFGDGFVMSLLANLFVFLWSLLLIIPGIIAAYSYSMSSYILYEHPGLRPIDAIRASKDLMQGNKWRLFCLHFSFIGWNLLAALTLGIGALWVNPYIEAAQASFYRQICYERSNGATTTFPNFTYNPAQHNRPNSYNNQGPEL